MSPHLSFLPATVAAAVAAVMLIVLFTVYVIPYGVIACDLGGPHVMAPDISRGDAYFRAPETIKLTVDQNGNVFIGSMPVPAARLAQELASVRARRPDVRLEIQGDGRAATMDVLRALRAARDAGYHEAYVFGGIRSILDANR